MENADTSVYGLARLETNDTKYINGLNNTTNQTITNNKVSNIEYEDYGYTEDITKGFGYNGEQQDQTGLIYLRARYYNPKLGRFIQIDPYKGTDGNLESKNRYTFVYNNPYKYVDMSGNEPLDPDDNWWKPKTTTAKPKTTHYDPNSPANLFIRSVNTSQDTNFPLIGEENRSVVWTDTQENRKLPKNNPYNVGPVTPRPCPKPTFLDGVGRAIGDLWDSTINLGKTVIDAGVDFVRDPWGSLIAFGGSVLNFLGGLWDTVTTKKFWVQLAVGTGAVLLTAAAVAFAPISLSAGAFAAIGAVSFSASGEAYDYNVTYDHDFDKMLEARGYSSAEEYFGSMAFKETMLGYSTYNMVNSLAAKLSNTGKALENANYAQKTFSNKFSEEGIRKYSKLVGEPINTIDDLVDAINLGKVNIADLPVEYIVRDSNTLILNTRTSQALTQAGIPRSKWNAINKTGDKLAEQLLTGQLDRNGLTSSGISNVRPSGGR